MSHWHEWEWQLALLLLGTVAWVATARIYRPAWHWGAVNAMSRIMGLVALIGGCISAIQALLALSGVIPRLRHNATQGQIVIGLVVSLAVFTLGALLCRVRTFRPDLGDRVRWLGKRNDGKDQSRSWWTGAVR